MVDSIAGVGAPQNISQVKNNQTQKNANSAPPTSAGDEVSLSSEALSLADIDATLAQARSGLESDTSASLSGGRNLDTLI